MKLFDSLGNGLKMQGVVCVCNGAILSDAGEIHSLHSSDHPMNAILTLSDSSISVTVPMHHLDILPLSLKSNLVPTLTFCEDVIQLIRATRAQYKNGG